MTEGTRLEPYYFHEQGFETLEAIEDWFEWEVPDRFNIATYVCDRWAEGRPDGVALYVDEGEAGRQAYTFEELQKRADQFADYLADRGIGLDDRVAVNGTQRFESLVAHVAAFKLGAVTVPLSVLLGTDGVRYRLEDCDVDAFVVDEAAIDTLEAVRDDLDALDLVVTCGDVGRPDDDSFDEAVAGRSTDVETVSTDPEDTAFIIYTSGTTGDPKGVVHAHRSLLGQLTQFVSLQVHRTGPEQVARTVAEWSWIMSLPGMLFPALFYGIPLVGSPSGRFEPEHEFELVEAFDVTHLNLPPTAVRMMMQVDRPAERYDLSSLQSLTTGGESADEALINWVGEVFENAAYIEGYGTTEIGGLVCDDPAVGLDHRMGSFGVPSVGHEVEVLDPETLEPVDEPGAIGQLAVRYEDDPMLFVEYLGLPETTAETIRDGWLISDDLVSKDEDGYFQFHARSDDVIISSGYRLAPVEIEEALLTHEAVHNAGVIGVPHETRGEIPKAFVVLDEGVEGDDELLEALQDHVKQRLAKYEYPRELEVVDELPLTTTGKVRRQTLREREGVAEE